MKKITVFGASGGTGRHVVERALAAGHQVAAVYRTQPAGLPTHPNLRVIVGDPLNAESVQSAVAGSEVVIHAIGPKRGPGARQTVTSEVMTNILPAMKRTGVKRLLFVSAWGTGASRRGFYGWLLWRMIGKRMADKEVAETMLRQSGLAWVTVLPTILTDDPRTGVVQAGQHLKLPMMPRITRADVAEFLVQQVESDKYLGQAVEISG